MTGQPSRRNYAAMKDSKLLTVIQELRSGGDAAMRAVNSGADPQADLAKATALAQGRGLSLPADDGDESSEGADDAPAGPQMVAAHLAKAMPVDRVPYGSHIEPKLDGFWLQLYADASGVRAWTRAGAVVDDRLPWHRRALATVVPSLRSSVRLVGELVHRDGQGSNLVHKAMRSVSKDPEALLTRDLQVVCFDVIELDGADMSGWPFSRRREVLADFLDPFIDSDDRHLGLIWRYDTAPAEAFAAAIADGYEGIVAKSPDHTYCPGARGAGVIKVKADATVDAVVCGWGEGQGEFAGMAGYLVVGQYDIDGQLVERGRVSSGMDFALRRAVMADPGAFVGRVLELRHMGSQAGGWRHPVLKRWRDDLAAASVDIHDAR